MSAVRAAPIGPVSLYWSAWVDGRDAYLDGRPITDCPYGDDRAYSGEAWRDGWRETAEQAHDPNYAGA